MELLAVALQRINVLDFRLLQLHIVRIFYLFFCVFELHLIVCQLVWIYTSDVKSWR